MPVTPVEVAPGVHLFEKVLPTGWSLNMFAIRGVEPDGIVLHSPTYIDDATYKAIEALGPVRALLCPNHFHWLSIRRYRERYPDARVVADPGAIQRLSKRLRLTPERATSWSQWRSPDGLKNGEGWLSLPSEGGPTWITSDAFFNVTRQVTGIMGTTLRTLQTVPGPCIGSTFRWVGVRDLATYRSWLERALSEEKPRRILVSHGEALEGESLAKLPALIEQRLS